MKAQQNFMRDGDDFYTWMVEELDIHKTNAMYCEWINCQKFKIWSSEYEISMASNHVEEADLVVTGSIK